MVYTEIVPKDLIIFDLAETGVVCDQIEDISWIVSRLEAHHLQMVILECHEVLSPACLNVSDKPITLFSERLVHNDIVSIAQDLTHDSSSFFRSNGIIIYTFFIFANFIKSINIM